MSTPVTDTSVTLQARASGDHRSSLPLLVRDYERRLIVEALVASRGSQRRAAVALGVSPTTLSMKMKRLGLRGEPPSPSPGRP
jgi:DNA-binding NtrC family response regulator